MGIIDALVAEEAAKAQKTAAPEERGFFGEVDRGLNSSLTGIHAGLRGMVGTGAEALGADQFAQQQYAKARALEQQAQLEAPRVTSYKQVLDDLTLRNMRDYTGGLIGGSLPSIAAGVGAGLGARTLGGAILRGTIANTPIEAGDIATKQLGDPQAMEQSPQERLLRQGVGGLGSAALQTVVPAVVGGKLVGRGAEQAAKRTFGQVLGQNALAIPEEAAFEGGSEWLKQQASNELKPTDWDAVVENAVGGGVAGGALSGLGTAGDLMHRNLPMARNAIGQAYDAARAKATQGKEALGVKVDEIKDSDPWSFVEPVMAAGAKMASAAGDAAKGVYDAMHPDIKAKGEKVAAWMTKKADEKAADIAAWKDELLKSDDIPGTLKEQIKQGANDAFVASVKAVKDGLPKAKKATKDYVETIQKALTPKATDPALDAMADGKPLDITNEQMGADGQAANDQTAIQKATAWAQDMLKSDKSLSEELKATLEQSLANVQSPAARRVIAGVKRTMDSASKKASDIGELAKAVGELAQKVVKPGTKQSLEGADLSNITDAITSTLVGKHDDVINNPKAMTELGGALRGMVQQLQSGTIDDLSWDVKSKLFTALGEDAVTLIDKVHKAVGQTSPEALKAYNENLLGLAREGQTRKALVDVIGNAMPKGMQLDPGAIADGLMGWATRSSSNDVGTKARQAYEDFTITDGLERMFGKSKAAKILKAVEGVVQQRSTKHKDISEDEKFSEDEQDYENAQAGEMPEDDGPRRSEGHNEVLQFGLGENKGESRPIGVVHAQQYVQNYKGKYPNALVSWKSLAELGEGEEMDEGYIVVEKPKSEERLTLKDYKSIRFDTKNYGGDKRDDRIDIPGRGAIDTTKIEKLGFELMKREGLPTSEARDVARNQAFAYGLAALRLDNEDMKGKIGPNTIVRRYTANPEMRNQKHIDELNRSIALMTEKLEKAEAEDARVLQGRIKKYKQDLDRAERAGDGIVRFRDIKEANYEYREGAGRTREVLNDMTDGEISDVISKTAMRIEWLEKAIPETKDPKEVRSLEWELKQANRELDKALEVREKRSDDEYISSNIAESGRYETDPHGNITEAAIGRNERELMTKVNMDETPRFTQTRRLYGGGPRGAEKNAKDAIADVGQGMVAKSTASAQALGHKILALVEHFDNMPANYKADLMSITAPLVWAKPQEHVKSAKELPNIDDQIRPDSGRILIKNRLEPAKEYTPPPRELRPYKPSEIAAIVNPIAAKVLGPDWAPPAPGTKPDVAKAIESRQASTTTQHFSSTADLRQQLEEQRQRFTPEIEKQIAALESEIAKKGPNYRIGGEEVPSLKEQLGMLTAALKKFDERAAEIARLPERESQVVPGHHPPVLEPRAKLVEQPQKPGHTGYNLSQRPGSTGPQTETVTYRDKAHNSVVTKTRKLAATTLDDAKAETADVNARVEESLKAIDKLIMKAKISAANAKGKKVDEGGTPDPKAVAAKQAAFLEKVRSGDKALLNTLKESTDAKGLQRAAEFLLSHDFEGVSESDQTADNVLDAIDTINARLAELVRGDESVAYGLQTKKYSLESTRGTKDPIRNIVRQIKEALGFSGGGLEGGVQGAAVYGSDKALKSVQRFAGGANAEFKFVGHPNKTQQAILDRAINSMPTELR